ncbi:hypothetical protein EXT65_21005 [Pectobacterium carotovorum subsp. carotovorum]|nr:hypothetical protein [Pectobacterium carotovorum]MCL6336275.1 hypothetical protein [Pectobacterium carotovorum subsp. carotovorum]
MCEKNPQSVELVVSFLGSLSRRSKLFKEIDIQLLRIVKADLIRILENRELELLEEKNNERKRNLKINEHLEKLKLDGIEVDELLVVSKGKRRPSVGMFRTYRIDGELVHYKGVGKYPQKLKQVIEREGKSGLDKYEEKD